MIRSDAEADQPIAALKQGLKAATEALWGLTPQPGRGQQPIRCEAQLKTEAEAIRSREWRILSTTPLPAQKTPPPNLWAVGGGVKTAHNGRSLLCVTR